ncbi:hypothetical protein NQ314_018924 [Rhamnusium bicolor]|uniref:Uncharacterized protein n=1 Tax=Rhamnusium bicolor TaxID=1586634 RepID=A0AAV8WPP2_9CUCU|nr:hypothetical protein NQ314_018924 [Rhamnusium bicolor]
MKWNTLLKKGLETDIRNQLVRRNPAPSNCAVQAPKLNPEAKMPAGDSAIKRDDRLFVIQNQIGACLAAIGKSLTILLSEEENERDKKLEALEALGDAGRLLCDVHHVQS